MTLNINGKTYEAGELIAYHKRLEKENAELRERLLKVENAYKRKSEAEWRLNDLYQKLLTDYANVEKCSREYFARYRVVLDRYIKAKELIENIIRVTWEEGWNYSLDWKVKAEQFLSEVE